MDRGIHRIFTDVAPTYDLVNRVLTFGMDIGWRKVAAKTAADIQGTYYLDICSGTGDMAFELKRRLPQQTKIICADFCEPMLRQTLKKAPGCMPVLADAGELPFDNGSFDVVTISFATRNLNSSRDMLIHRFSEFHRVLKPGGVFVNVETSQPSNPFICWCFHRYVSLFVAPVGRMISGSGGGYGYLSASIPRFYNAMELTRVMCKAGFDEVQVHPLLFGAAAVHVAHKTN